MDDSPGKSFFHSANLYRVGVGLIYLGAFLSGLDGSLFLTLASLGVFLIYLGYHTRPRPAIHTSFNRSSSSGGRPAGASTYSTPAPTPAQNTGTTQKNVKILVVVGSILGFLIIPFLFILFFFAGGGESAVEMNIRALGHYNQGAYDSAALYYRKALNIDPDDAEALVGAGNSKSAMEDYDSATYFFDRALENDPENNEALYGRGLAYLNRQRPAEAVREGKALYELNPGYRQATLLIGDGYFDLQKFDSACYWYEAGYQSELRSAALSNRLAYLYDQKGETDKAIEFYQEAISYDTTLVEVYDRLAELSPPQEAITYREMAQRLRSR